LQVFNKADEWVDAPITPGAYIVNHGESMARLTNEVWVSTLHRVVNPTPENGGNARRQSIAFFHQPNWHAPVECLPGCGSVDNLPRHAPVTSGAHFERKLALLRGEAPAD
jgi:isopenicillin N synthase-like dioxygenase